MFSSRDYTDDNPPHEGETTIKVHMAKMIPHNPGSAASTHFYVKQLDETNEAERKKEN